MRTTLHRCFLTVTEGLAGVAKQGPLTQVVCQSPAPLESRSTRIRDAQWGEITVRSTQPPAAAVQFLAVGEVGRRLKRPQGKVPGASAID
jgi:hypothetical protein